jgi:hypothetical protein
LLETLRALSNSDVTLDVGSVGSEVSIASGRGYDPNGYDGLCLTPQIEEALKRAS